MIPAVAARSLLVGSVSVCDRLKQVMVFPLCLVSCVAAHRIVRYQFFGPVRDIALLLTRTLKNQTNNQSGCPRTVAFKLDAIYPDSLCSIFFVFMVCSVFLRLQFRLSISSALDFDLNYGSEKLFRSFSICTFYR